MAHVYVRSGAGGAGTGADWTNAYTTLAAALTAKAAGDQFWVADDHAETQGSAMTLTSPGTAASPCTVACVNRAGSVPPVAADLRTTATITVTGAFAMTLNGHAYFYGIAFTSGSGANSVTTTLGNSASHGLRFKNCAWSFPATSAGFVFMGAQSTHTGSYIEWDNVTHSVGNTSTKMVPRSGKFVWRNTPSAIVGTPPGILYNLASGSGYAGVTIFDGVDLSAISSTIFEGSGNSARAVLLINCKIHASATITSAPAQPGLVVHVVRSDSAGTNYRHEKYEFAGTQVVETTIVRTGGASDGTTPLAWKLVSTSGAKWISPFESLPMAVWLDTTSSVTLTVYGIAATLPTQDDVWIEATYLGASGSPLGSLATSGKANFLATAANNSSDASAWGGSTTAFKMAVTFTPAQKGFVSVVVKVGGASKTIYIDPKTVVT